MLQVLVQLHVITMRYLVLVLILSALVVRSENVEESDIRLTPLPYFGDDIGLHAVEFRTSPNTPWKAFYLYRLEEPEHIRRKASIICRQAGRSEPSYLVRLDLVSVANVFANPSQEWYLLSVCEGTEERIQECRRYFAGRYGQWDDQTKENKYAVGVICNPASDTTTLRLIGGANNKEGVVYSFSERSWGPVCAQYNHHLPNIVCKELGFNSRSQWASSDIFEAPPYTPEPAKYFNGTCAPGAQRLDNCSHVPIVDMRQNIECLQLAVICDTGEADVRIVDGEYELTKGLVEILFQDEWRPVCVDLTKSLLPAHYSKIVCNQLGFNNGSSHAIAVEPTLYSDVSTSANQMRYPHVWFDVAGCSENMTSLEECQTSPIGSVENCNSRPGFAYVGVACNDNASLPMRLVEGDIPSEGIVEVYSETYQYWGGVLIYADFNNDSQSKYSEIVCRQLGIETNGASYMIAPEYFNVSSSRDRLQGVWLHILSCSGDEERIEDCRWKQPMGAYPDADDLNIGYVMLAVVCDPGTIPRTLRLTGSSDLTRGRVEINSNGRWNRICAEDSRYHLWTGSTADVMCRQMGFESWSFLLTPGTVGRGSGPILMTSGNCTGRESSFDECFDDIFGRQSDGECQDITLACNVDEPILLRLIGGTVPSEGILEINFNGQAGSICDLDWNHQDTLVACRQLGFPDGISYAISEDTFATEGIQPWRTWLQTVSCNGDEANILDCPHSPWGLVNYECDVNSPPVSLICNAPIPEIRLSGTGYPNKGVVEINFREEWGVICADSQWTDAEAAVVCNQLGYSGLAFATSQGAFCPDGMESKSFRGRRVWLAGIDCIGTEEALALCRFVPWTFTDQRSCSEESFIAGVICEGKSVEEEDLSTKNEPRGYQDDMMASTPSGLHPLLAMILLGIIVILILVVLILSVMVYFLRKRGHHYIEAGQTEQECCEPDNEGNM